MAVQHKNQCVFCSDEDIRTYNRIYVLYGKNYVGNANKRFGRHLYECLSNSSLREEL